MDRLSFILSYPSNKNSWECEVVDYNDIEKYFDVFNYIDSNEEKVSLSELIIESINDMYELHLEIDRHVVRLKTILLTDFTLFRDVINYWCCWDNGNDLDLCWNITPLMREIYEFGIADSKLNSE